VAHRTPTLGDAKTGDALRVTVVLDACLQCLGDDLRVDEHYHPWVAARDLERRHHLAWTWAGTTRGADYSAALQQAWTTPPTETELAALWQTLQGMRVPWPWTAPLLLESFPLRFRNAHLDPGEQHWGWTLVGVPVPDTKPGRQPRHQGEDLARFVTYWYRCEIKHPPDPLPALEAEEQARTGQTNWKPDDTRRNTVLKGIHWVKTLLAGWQHPWVPDKCPPLMP
jgi:hypothetical protein